MSCTRNALIFDFCRHRYTKLTISTTTAVYAITLDWPQNGTLRLGAPKLDSSGFVFMLGYQQQVKFTPEAQGGITIQVPVFTDGQLPCKHAWVFRMLGVKNQGIQEYSVSFLSCVLYLTCTCVDFCRISLFSLGIRSMYISTHMNSPTSTSSDQFSLFTKMDFFL